VNHVTEYDMIVDALAMAKYTAVLNLESALNMDNPQSKQVHLQMSQDDARIVFNYQQQLKQLGWDQAIMSNPREVSQVREHFQNPQFAGRIPVQQPEFI